MKKTKRYLQGGPVDASPDDGTGGGGAGVGYGGGIPGEGFGGGNFEDITLPTNRLKDVNAAKENMFLNDAGDLAFSNRSFAARQPTARLEKAGVDMQGLIGGRPNDTAGQYKKGGAVKKMAKGGSTSSASKRADGCAQRGKTKGRFV